MEVGNTCLSCQNLTKKFQKLHVRFSLYKEKCVQNDALINTFRKQNILLKALKEELAQKDSAFTEVCSKLKVSELECTALRQTLEKEKDDNERRFATSFGQTELKLTTLKNELEDVKTQLDAQRVANIQLSGKLEEEIVLRKGEKETYTREKGILVKKMHESDMFRSTIKGKMQHFSSLKNDKKRLIRSVLNWITVWEKNAEAASLEANLASDTDSPKRRQSGSLDSESDGSPLRTPQKKLLTEGAGYATDSSRDSDFEEISTFEIGKTLEEKPLFNSGKDGELENSSPNIKMIRSRVSKTPSPRKASAKKKTTEKSSTSRAKRKTEPKEQMPPLPDLDLSEDDLASDLDLQSVNGDDCLEAETGKNQEPSEKACITSVLEDVSYHRDAVSPLPGVRVEEPVKLNSRADSNATSMGFGENLLIGGSAQGATQLLHGSSPLLSRLCVICVKLLLNCELCVDVVHRFKDFKCPCDRLYIAGELNTPPLSTESVECNEEERSVFSPTPLRNQESFDFGSNLPSDEMGVNSAVATDKVDVSCQTLGRARTSDFAVQTTLHHTRNFTPDVRNIGVQTHEIRSPDKVHPTLYFQSTSTQTDASRNVSNEKIEDSQKRSVQSTASQTTPFDLLSEATCTVSRDGEVRADTHRTTKLCKEACVQTDSLSFNMAKASLSSPRSVKSVRSQTDNLADRRCDVSLCNVRQFFQTALSNLIDQAAFIPNCGGNLTAFAPFQPAVNVQSCHGTQAGLVSPTICHHCAPNGNQVFQHCGRSCTSRSCQPSYVPKLKTENHLPGESCTESSYEGKSFISSKRKSSSRRKSKLLSTDLSPSDQRTKRSCETLSTENESHPRFKKRRAVISDSSDEDDEVLAVRMKRECPSSKGTSVCQGTRLPPKKKSKMCGRNRISSESSCSDLPVEKTYSRIRTLLVEEDKGVEETNLRGLSSGKPAGANSPQQKPILSPPQNVVRAANHTVLAQNEHATSRDRNAKVKRNFNMNTFEGNLRSARSAIQFVKEKNIQPSDNVGNTVAKSSEKVKSLPCNEKSERHKTDSAVCVPVGRSDFLNRRDHDTAKSERRKAPTTLRGRAPLAKEEHVLQIRERIDSQRRDASIQSTSLDVSDLEGNVKSSRNRSGAGGEEGFVCFEGNDAVVSEKRVELGSPGSEITPVMKEPLLSHEDDNTSKLINGVKPVVQTALLKEKSSVTCIEGDAQEASARAQSTQSNQIVQHKEDALKTTNETDDAQKSGNDTKTPVFGLETTKEVDEAIAVNFLEDDLCLSDEGGDMSDGEDSCIISEKTQDEQNVDAEADEPMSTKGGEDEKIKSADSDVEMTSPVATETSSEIPKESQPKEKVEEASCKDAHLKLTEESLPVTKSNPASPAVSKRHLPMQAIPLGPRVTRRARKMPSHAECSGTAQTSSETQPSPDKPATAVRTSSRLSRLKSDLDSSQPAKRKLCTSKSGNDTEEAKGLAVDGDECRAEISMKANEDNSSLKEGFQDSDSVMSEEASSDKNNLSSIDARARAIVEHVNESSPSSISECEVTAISTVSNDERLDGGAPSRRLRPRTCRVEQDGSSVAQRRSLRTRLVPKKFLDSGEVGGEEEKTLPDSPRLRVASIVVKKASKLEKLRSSVSRVHPLAHRMPMSRADGRVSVLENLKADKSSEEDPSPGIQKLTGSLQMPKSGRTAVVINEDPRRPMLSGGTKGIRKAVAQQMSSPAVPFAKPRVTPQDRIAATLPTTSSPVKNGVASPNLSESPKADSPPTPHHSTSDAEPKLTQETAASSCVAPVYKRSNALLTRSRPSPLRTTNSQIHEIVSPTPAPNQVRQTPSACLPGESADSTPPTSPPAKRRSLNIWCDLAASSVSESRDPERTADRRLPPSTPADGEVVTGPALIALINSTERESVYSEELVQDDKHPLLLAWNKNCETRFAERPKLDSQGKILSSKTAIYKIMNRYLASAYFTEEVLDNTARCLLDPNLIYTVSFVARYVVDNVEQDYDSKPCSDTASPGRYLTKNQQQLVALVMRLFPTYRNIVSDVLQLIQYRLFRLNQAPEGDRVSWLARMHTALCRIMKWRSSSLTLCYDAMYCYVSRFAQVIVPVFELWPQLLPDSVNVQSAGIHAQVLFHYIMTQGKPEPYSDMKNLRDLLVSKKIYSGNTNSFQLIEKIIHLMEGRSNLKVAPALIMVAKREAIVWSEEHIVNKKLLPLVGSWFLDNDETKCAAPIDAIWSLCAIVRAFYGSEQSVKATVTLMKNLLLDTKAVAKSPALEHIACAGLVCLARHDVEIVVDALKTWRPNSQLPMWLLNLLCSLMKNRSRTVSWWRKEIGAMSAENIFDLDLSPSLSK